MDRTPRERLVINLFGWLMVSGVYLVVSYHVIGLFAFSELSRVGREFTVTGVLCWVFAFPVMVLHAVGLPWGSQFEGWMPNALVYGGVLWFGWRMWKLFRRKQQE